MATWQRVALIAVLLVALTGLLVWYDTLDPDRADNNLPEASDVKDNPGTYVAERVSVGGTVVETDPLTIEDEGLTFVIENAAADSKVEAGDRLRVHGTLDANNHIDVSTTIHSEPWEYYYMYVVSLVAGLWVLGRGLNRWTVDSTNWSVVPRAEPVVTLRR